MWVMFWRALISHLYFEMNFGDTGPLVMVMSHSTICFSNTTVVLNHLYGTFFLLFSTSAVQYGYYFFPLPMLTFALLILKPLLAVVGLKP